MQYSDNPSIFPSDTANVQPAASASFISVKHTRPRQRPALEPALHHASRERRSHPRVHTAAHGRIRPRFADPCRSRSGLHRAVNSERDLALLQKQQQQLQKQQSSATPRLVDSTAFAPPHPALRTALPNCVPRRHTTAARPDLDGDPHNPSPLFPPTTTTTSPPTLTHHTPALFTSPTTLIAHPPLSFRPGRPTPSPPPLAATTTSAAATRARPRTAAAATSTSLPTATPFDPLTFGARQAVPPVPHRSDVRRRSVLAAEIACARRRASASSLGNDDEAGLACSTTSSGGGGGKGDGAAALGPGLGRGRDDDGGNHLDGLRCWGRDFEPYLARRRGGSSGSGGAGGSGGGRGIGARKGSHGRKDSGTGTGSGAAMAETEFSREEARYFEPQTGVGLKF